MGLAVVNDNGMKVDGFFAACVGPAYDFYTTSGGEKDD